jgi:transcriptional regulator with XRE-family HTH domain
MDTRDIENRVRINLIRLRKQARLSQEELAEWSGVHGIAHIERGARTAGLSAIIQLAVALKVDVSELFKPLEPNVEEEALLKVFRHCTESGRKRILQMIQIFVDHEDELKNFLSSFYVLTVILIAV